MAEDITVRPFTDGDLEPVLDVMRAALGEPPGLGRTPALFSWKHLDNPFGRSLMLVAESEGRIAGFRAFMRWELRTPSGETVRCVRAVDTATHPDFQRRGIFRTLTLAGIDLASDEGVDLIFNTPNAKSGAGYLKMGWQQVGPIGVMARPGGGVARPGGEWPDASAFDPGRAIDAGLLDGLADVAATGLRTPRTREYLRWRFASHPTGRYAVAGSRNGAVTGRLNHRRERRELVISEVVGDGAPAAARTLRRVLRPAYSVGWFSEGTPERALARRCGLYPVPRVTALTLVARPLRELPVDVTDARAWHLGLGDLELL